MLLKTCLYPNSLLLPQYNISVDKTEKPNSSRKWKCSILLLSKWTQPSPWNLSQWKSTFQMAPLKHSFILSANISWSLSMTQAYKWVWIGHVAAMTGFQSRGGERRISKYCSGDLITAMEEFQYVDKGVETQKPLDCRQHQAQGLSRKECWEMKAVRAQQPESHTKASDHHPAGRVASKES